MKVRTEAALGITDSSHRMSDTMRSDAERVAAAFHEAYERLAPDHGYETRKASAVPWGDVPERNRQLMVATVFDLLSNNVIDVVEP